jgi:hypothetical protein
MGMSLPSSEGGTTSVGVDATDDGRLDRGLGRGDFDVRPRRDASRWARS